MNRARYKANNFQYFQKSAGMCLLCYRRKQRNTLVNVRVQKGGQGVQTPPPLKNHKFIGFPSYHKTVQSAFNGGTLSVGQRNAISMAICWQADNYPFLVVFGAWIPSTPPPPPPPKKKKKKKSWTPSEKNFLDPRILMNVRSVMPRSHIHGSPSRFYYGLNLTDNHGNANFRSPIRMHYIRMIKYYYVRERMQYGKLRTNTDCHECTSVTKSASSP